jgi:nucleoside-diphosphate-sugar epimerase
VTGPVLVFGATGFLGRHVHAALSAGHDVVTVAGRNRDADYRIDLTARSGPATVAALLTATAPAAVVNCAGATAGELTDLVATNVTAVAALLEAAALAAPGIRLVHLGSAAEYGPGVPGEPLAESAAPRPVGGYGVTKLAGSELVRQNGTVDGVVLRVFNPLGPGAPGSSLPGRLAAELRRATAAGDAVRLGRLDAWRDFVDVRDVGAAVAAAVRAPDAGGRVLNVGAGRAVPLADLVRAMASAADYRGEVHELGAGSARSATVSWQQADIRQAREVLGWRPCYDLAAAVQDLWLASAP